jgi:hypothetical protein
MILQNTFLDPNRIGDNYGVAIRFSDFIDFLIGPGYEKSIFFLDL